MILLSLSYSLNDGLTWKSITNTSQLNLFDGGFSWTVPVVSKIKQKCKVKVVFMDIYRKMIGDVSDGVFTIIPAP